VDFTDRKITRQGLEDITLGVVEDTFFVVVTSKDANYVLTKKNIFQVLKEIERAAALIPIQVFLNTRMYVEDSVTMCNILLA
jgi:hypothetical protein